MLNQNIIDQFVLNPSEKNMDTLIERAKLHDFSVEDTAHLARKLAISGDIIKNDSLDTVLIDIPSTGGPSSLSTLICPLIMMELNYQVPKLGIKGRPAGGIDVMNQIYNYKIHFNKNEIVDIILSSGYCHFISSKKFAPLDAKLFKYRSKVGAKSVPALVIASILSKKLAAGLTHTGLDVRVFEQGNFGNNYEIAIKNSLKFIEVAKIVGISAKCFINDFSFLQQPYVGRGESLVALYKIFNNEMAYMLNRHLNNCISMAFTVCPDHLRLNNPITLNGIFKSFEKNLIAQGSSLVNFYNKVDKIISEHNRVLKSPNDGFLLIDLNSLRNTIVKYQVQSDLISEFPDPCGVIFKKNSNDYVLKGDVLLTYRVNHDNYESFENDLNGCFSVNQYPIETSSFKII